MWIFALVFFVLALTAPAHAAPPCDDHCPTLVASSSVKAPAALDLRALEIRLRQTRAIGFFTKLSLKQQVDDLLDQFARFHEGHGGRPLPTLRDRFDGLMGKVLALLDRRDDGLAREVAASRESLWALLANPRTFSTVRRQAKSDF